MHTTVNWLGTQNRSFCVKPLVCIALAALLVFTMAACGEKPGGGEPTVSSVRIIPATKTVVAKGGTLNFTATVTGTNNPSQNVTWSVDGTNKHAGTVISSDGELSVSADQTAPTTLTVRATSVEDSSKSGEIEVNVYESEADIPTVTSVTVSPSTTSIMKGGTQTFTVTVTGTNDPPQTVTWAITQTGKHSGTTINDEGKLTVSASESLSTLTVRATSKVDNTKNGTATVTVTTPLTPGNGFFTFPISGKDVYLDEWEEDEDSGAWTFIGQKVTDKSCDGNYAYMYDGYNSSPLSDYITGSTEVKITNDKLSINLGTPETGALYSVVSMLEDDFPFVTFTISDRQAQVFLLYGFYNEDGVGLYYVEGAEDDIYLCYVDRNVTITGSHTETGTNKEDEEYTYTVTFALDLKAGWNYMRFTEYEEEVSGEIVDKVTFQTAQPTINAVWIVGEPGSSGGVDPTDGSFSFPISNKDVYLFEESYENDDWVITFTKVGDNSYDGDYAYLEDWPQHTRTPLSDVIEDSTVTITNGKLTVNLGTPKTDALESISDNWYGGLDVDISNRDAKMFMIEEGGFGKQDGSVGLVYMGDDHLVLLVYVDSDVTISGTHIPEGGGSKTVILELNLKQGWNYVKVTQVRGNGNIIEEAHKTARPGSDSKWIIFEP